MFAVMMAVASAFVAPSSSSTRRSSLQMTFADQAPPAAFTTSPQIPAVTTSVVASSGRLTVDSVSSSNSGALRDGVVSFAGSSTSNVLSLQDRKPPPTKEEIEAKKRNFAFWFWGGGFVAPFLATFYYFGFKFWEK